MPVILPLETFDHIVGHIDVLSDILNVGLTNKALYSIAVLQHLQYRDIRTSLQNPVLWSKLSRLDDRHVAQIRFLTIVPDDCFEFNEMFYNHSYDLRSRIPAEFSMSEHHWQSDLTREACWMSEASLVSTLKRMSGLRRFRWYRARPSLVGEEGIWSALERLGTVKEVDVFDAPVCHSESTNFLTTSIPRSDTFLRFGGFTSFKLTSACAGYPPDDPEVGQLEQMLLKNCPHLEVLCLKLDLQGHLDETACINRLLQNALWPNLRALHLGGVNCRVPELTRFLIAHPNLEELTLGTMMMGHAWTRLDLPAGSLPKLRYLECSSFQAAALMKNTSTRRLASLRGVEVHDKIIDYEYFSWDEDWEVQGDHRDSFEEQPSPWKGLFLEFLKAQNSITCLGVTSIDSPQEMEILSTIAPQLKELDIHLQEDSIPASEWLRLYSLFPALEIIRGANPRLLGAQKGEKFQVFRKNIQALVTSCPRLRVIGWGSWGSKVIVTKGVDLNLCIKLVMRKSHEIEDPDIKSGETEYCIGLHRNPQPRTDTRPIIAALLIVLAVLVAYRTM